MDPLIRRRMEKDHYYKVLGIEADATAEEIKKAWKARAAELHPDQNPGDAEAALRFGEAREAFDSLYEAKRRLEAVRAEEAERRNRQAAALVRRPVEPARPMAASRQRSESSRSSDWAVGLGVGLGLVGLGLGVAFLADRHAPRDASGRHSDRHTGQYRKGYFL